MMARYMLTEPESNLNIIIPECYFMFVATGMQGELLAFKGVPKSIYTCTDSTRFSMTGDYALVCGHHEPSSKNLLCFPGNHKTLCNNIPCLQYIHIESFKIMNTCGNVGGGRDNP